MANKSEQTTINVSEKASVIWNIANALAGYFKPKEYGTVILPMTVIKRFHDCLLPTQKKVLKKYEEVKHLEVIEGFLTKASEYQFYNTSKFTFDALVGDPDNIESNFKDYISGFSSNIQDILARFNFDDILKRVIESGALYVMIKEFASEKGYLGPDKVTAVDCGYIFEELVRMFSEDDEAGAHFTSRDIIYTMTDLLLVNEDLSKLSNVTVYDQTMGTSQMLTCMEERIHKLNPDIDVNCFGQEFNPSTYAIAKADMMIRGGDPDNMRFGNTLDDDKFDGYKFKYCISNPPFGIDWKKEQKSVEKEAARGENGRFPCGLPKISDGQQLFMMNGISKMDVDGRMAIIQNGSPLFTGDAGSGPSNIRQYMIENDWLDAIIQLFPNGFMNTPITTYIWILDKNKPSHRAGKVQLIDASHCFVPRSKSIGNKRYDISDKCRKLIVDAYVDYKNNKIYKDNEKNTSIFCESMIIDSLDFGYNKIIIERPLRDNEGNIILKKGRPSADSKLRDTENIPLKEDIDDYFNREVKPFVEDAWIDKTKTKIGYEIPMTRFFYKYHEPEKSKDIERRINILEKDVMKSIKELFGDK